MGGGGNVVLGEEEEEQAWREAEMQQLQINELNGQLAALQTQLEGGGAGSDGGLALSLSAADGAGKARPGSRQKLPAM